jgi:hypothetical protein
MWGFFRRLCPLWRALRLCIGCILVSQSSGKYTRTYRGQSKAITTKFVKCCLLASPQGRQACRAWFVLAVKPLVSCVGAALFAVLSDASSLMGGSVLVYPRLITTRFGRCASVAVVAPSLHCCVAYCRHCSLLLRTMRRISPLMTCRRSYAFGLQVAGVLLAVALTQRKMRCCVFVLLHGSVIVNALGDVVFAES